MKNNNIVVVIPAFKVSKQIVDVVKTIPEFVNFIIVVDDKCPQNSGAIAESLNDNRVKVVYHEVNEGVGAAVISGYKEALKLDADIVVKVDGDGQMDPEYMLSLIEPIVNGEAEYAKGNRFKDFKALKSMPKVRLFGNSILSFLVKIASGYWNIMDPTNGYTAISKKAIDGISLENLSKRYFFESDILINLNLENMVVKDIAIPARYFDEDSSLNIKKVIYQFPPKILKGFCKRIFYKYFIYDFNMASVYMLFGLPMLSFGVIYGTYRWYIGMVEHISNSTGIIMLAVLPIILGVQFLLQAVHIDINSIPKKGNQ